MVCSFLYPVNSLYSRTENRKPKPMTRKCFSAGLRSIARRPGLVVLIYAINFIVAFLLALPIAIALGGKLAVYGFGTDMTESLDLVLLVEVLERAGDLFGMLWVQFLWMIPLWLVWKAASRAGLIHALRGDAIRSFWQGVGRYTGRAVLISLLFLVPVIGWAVAVVLLGVSLAALWPGEVGVFWTFFVAVPTLLIAGFAVLDLMQDYAVAALVIEEKSVGASVRTGYRFPIRHGQASWLYMMWFALALLALALPTVLDMAFATATAVGIWLLFIVQQLVLFARAAVTVGWLGSEAALYETVWFREAPLIAEEAASATSEELPVAPDAESHGLATA